ncbi:hypothetical protein ACGF1Z_13665 [Streptomyces sp. NPDC048018]|uniref:hypothetical protein n=1 Tax=Streptomyces sp. NPDC048018 TaxID=3365499 RepID=UPI0037121627
MKHDEGDEPRDEEAERRQNRYWAIGVTITLVVLALFLISIDDDSGPVCGTGQDKYPC